MLSFRTIKYLPAMLWILCGGAALTSYHFVIEPGHHHIVKDIAARNVLESRIQANLSLLAQSKEVRRRAKIAQKVFAGSGVSGGATLAIGRSLPRLQSLAQRLHVRLRSIVIEPKVENQNTGLLISREATVVVRGSFGDELSFLRRMTQFPGVAIRLNSASFSSHGSGADVIAKASISLLSSAPTRDRAR